METAASPMHPILELIHVTDLHVKHISANPNHALAGKGRLIARVARKHIEKHDRFGWDAGTQGHYPKAPESFRRFLRDWRSLDPLWRDTPVWLIDTGDRTAFGDHQSIEAGNHYISLWRKELGDCPVLSLYGNHDAWPGTLPGLHPGGIGHQKKLLINIPGWNPDHWLTAPLRTPIPGTSAHIELFAFDTICWGPFRNTRAVGQITKATMTNFLTSMRSAASCGQQSLRILAMHHPLTFPWEAKETKAFGVVSAMKLIDERRHAEKLRNDGNDPASFGPLVHLVLSGHTHLRYPAERLSGDVTGVHQGTLSAWQLQLVGGPLMLNKSRQALLETPHSKPVSSRQNKQFPTAAVDDRNCQAQILRFYKVDDQPDALELIRIPISSVDGSRYVAEQPDSLRLYYNLPC